MEYWFPGNIALFKLLNASMTPFHLLRSVAHLLAVDAIFVLMLAMIVTWFIGTPEQRRVLMLGFVAVVIGLVANMVVGAIFPTERPFVDDLGSQWLSHAADSSFPSDHGTVFFTIGLIFFHSAALRRFGRVVLWTGLGVAWARIYLGVHFPLDFLGSFVVSFGAVVAALRLEPRLAPWMDRIEEWHDSLGHRAP